MTNAPKSPDAAAPKKRGGKRPNSGRKPLSDKGSTVPRIYRLPPDLAEWADSQGGAAYVRQVIEQDRTRRLIV